MSRLRRRWHRLVHREPVPDVWQRTERERRLEQVAARQRRYLRTAPLMLGLVLVALLAPLPDVVRLVILLAAALLAPVALGATLPRR